MFLDEITPEILHKIIIKPIDVIPDIHDKIKGRKLVKEKIFNRRCEKNPIKNKLGLPKLT
jgi:hypothetical protein